MGMTALLGNRTRKAPTKLPIYQRPVNPLDSAPPVHQLHPTRFESA
jgi:hypothetical protein